MAVRGPGQGGCWAAAQCTTSPECVAPLTRACNGAHTPSAFVSPRHTHVLQCPFASKALGQLFVRPAGKNRVMPTPPEFWTPPPLSSPSSVRPGHPPPRGRSCVHHARACIRTIPGAPRPLPCPPPAHNGSQLDAAGYKQLISEVRKACDAGDLSPPTLCRLGFHSVHIAASVGRGWGANGARTRVWVGVVTRACIKAVCREKDCVKRASAHDCAA
jgi:hypothetical protein